MEWLPKHPLTQPIYAVSINGNAGPGAFGWVKFLLGRELVRRAGAREDETVRMQNVRVMEDDRVQVAIIDHLATSRAAVKVTLFLRRQILEPLFFHSK